MEQFMEKMAEVLDVNPEVLSLDTRFREIDGYSSMVGFSLLITLEEEYGVNLPVDAFLQINTLGELYKKVTRSDQ
jgi:acyl carrier protein